METKENNTGEREKMRMRLVHSRVSSHAHADDVGHAQQYASGRSQWRGQEDGRYVSKGQ